MRVKCQRVLSINPWPRGKSWASPSRHAGRRLLGLEQLVAIEVDRAETVAGRHIIPGAEAIGELLDALFAVGELLVVIGLVAIGLLLGFLLLGLVLGIVEVGGEGIGGDIDRPGRLWRGLGRHRLGLGDQGRVERDGHHQEPVFLSALLVGVFLGRLGFLFDVVSLAAGQLFAFAEIGPP